MPTNSNNQIWTIRWAKAIQEVPRKSWDRLAVPLHTPLLEWQWLHHLEASGSIAHQNGWYPCHLTLWAGDQLRAAAPLYIKTHSQGEFVFDHWLVELSEKNGIDYYPKLVGMSPATPAEGYQFLIDDGLDRMSVVQTMLGVIDQLCEKMGISVCQFNFVDSQWLEPFSQADFLAWNHQGYLWRNPGYADFNDYLKPFKSSQRRNIRREVNRIKKAGLRIVPLRGNDIPSRLATVMYDYYLRTNAQYGPWAARFLNAEFFKRIFDRHRYRLLVMAAYDTGNEQNPLALSLLLVKGDHLIGRYWGCAKQVKDLHFNMCFYAPIRWAIANGIETFDPGAGSPHKIYRGFKAAANTSVHRFYDPRLKFLFQRLVNEANRMTKHHIDNLNMQLPFAQRNDPEFSCEQSELPDNDCQGAADAAP